MRRRKFISTTAAVSLVAAAQSFQRVIASDEVPRYRLSLGQWTFHRAFRGEPGFAKRDPLEFPTMAGEMGFEGVDYSGLLLGEQHTNPESLTELNRRAADAGVKNLLLLIDIYDPLGASSEEARNKTVEKYRPWLNAAATLGCTGIRVNAISDVRLPADEQSRLVADGVTKLLALSKPMNLEVLVENHGEGVRCDGAWIASIVKQVGQPQCGTLPDFGNFQKDRKIGTFHDRYSGVAAMLPLAKCISAKAHDFDADGEECYTDYARMLRLVTESGYQGWIEVEYEGPGGPPRTPEPERPPVAALGEREGALATVRLLKKYLGKAMRVKG
jgi:L-ribulose-5-phosphate 3-epimerase